MSTDRERDDVASAFEEQGLPDLEDGAPEQRWARDPERAPVPGDRPAAVESYGTTYAEMHEGESLDQKLEREIDHDEEAGRLDEDSVGRLVAEGDDGVEDAEKQELARDVGLDLGGASAEEAAMHVEPG
jgi:hypothetical protein